LPRRLQDYAHIHYLLVARDHWPWMEPQDGIALVAYDVFADALLRVGALNNAIELLTYDWLPVEGRDFRVQFDRVTVNGVLMESEVYYAIAPG
jgi:hypothetical protein